MACRTVGIPGCCPDLFTVAGPRRLRTGFREPPRPCRFVGGMWRRALAGARPPPGWAGLALRQFLGRNPSAPSEASRGPCRHRCRPRGTRSRTTLPPSNVHGNRQPSRPHSRPRAERSSQPGDPPAARQERQALLRRQADGRRVPGQARLRQDHPRRRRRRHRPRRAPAGTDRARRPQAAHLAPRRPRLAGAVSRLLAVDGADAARRPAGGRGEGVPALRAGPPVGAGVGGGGSGGAGACNDGARGGAEVALRGGWRRRRSWRNWSTWTTWRVRSSRRGGRRSDGRYSARGRKRAAKHDLAEVQVGFHALVAVCCLVRREDATAVWFRAKYGPSRGRRHGHGLVDDHLLRIPPSAWRRPAGLPALRNRR